MATSTNEDSPVTLTPPLVSDTSPSPIDDEEQSRTWQSKYEALAKLYTQLRNEHLSLLGQLKPLRLASGEMSITAITSKVASYEKKITSLEAWAAGLEQQLKEYSVSRSEHVENNLAPAVAARELDALKRRNQDLESKVKVQEAEFGRQQNSIRALEQRLDESKMALKQVTGGRMGQASSSGGPINSGSISAARDIIFQHSIADTVQLARSFQEQGSTSKKLFNAIHEDCSFVGDILACANDRALKFSEIQDLRNIVAGTHLILEEIRERVSKYEDAPHSDHINWESIPGFRDFMEKVKRRLKESLEPLNQFEGRIFRTTRERRIVERIAQRYGLRLDVLSIKNLPTDLTVDLEDSSDDEEERSRWNQKQAADGIRAMMLMISLDDPARAKVLAQYPFRSWNMPAGPEGSHLEARVISQGDAARFVRYQRNHMLCFCFPSSEVIEPNRSISMDFILTGTATHIDIIKDWDPRSRWDRPGFPSGTKAKTSLSKRFRSWKSNISGDSERMPDLWTMTSLPVRQNEDTSGISPTRQSAEAALISHASSSSQGTLPATQVQQAPPLPPSYDYKDMRLRSLSASIGEAEGTKSQEYLGYMRNSSPPRSSRASNSSTRPDQAHRDDEEAAEDIRIEDNT